MRVWIVVYDDYDWETCADIEAVRSSREAALSYVDAQPPKERKYMTIHEWEVDGDEVSEP